MMSRIKKLPPEIVSRIAAGEVVERPMNIVKELVENALDADATSVFVTIIEGGKTGIKVQDNGSGIKQDELPLAIELHTTSKMDEGDPSLVQTLGFRGEALASIAAVCRVEISSQHESESSGRKLVVEGGKILSDTSITSSQGSTIQISGIFFNTPARRKFLKTPATERKRITDLLSNYCLMYPEVHFKLDEQLKSGSISQRLESPSRKSMMAVIYDILGYDLANELVPFDTKIGQWDIEGFISKPSVNRSDRSLQFINVNGRPIRHKDLQATIEDAYKSQLLRSTHPVLILKMNGPTDAVDFNIHPQKSEIRFKSDDMLLQQIPEKILEVLASSVELPELQKKKLDRIRKSKSTTNKKSKSSISSTSNTTKQSQSVSQSSSVRPSKTTPEPKEPVKFTSKTIQKSLFNETILEPSSGRTVLGHIMNKFGLVYTNNELWLVDVHAADERVKFEMYASSMVRDLSSQQFLQPVQVFFTSSEIQLLLDHKEDLKRFGLKLSKAGTTSIFVHSMPVYYDQDITPESISDLLQDILSHLNDEDTERGAINTPLDEMEYSIISRLACHGSIRSGYAVSNQRINQVLDDLMKCEYPWTCAHGRPTVLRLPKTRLEGFFKR